jgi:nucleoside-diphosphate-sugar epimerase
MKIVILRPPLIYGQGVKGNFLQLMKLVKLPVPIPLGSISNERSFVSIENFVDLLLKCICSPQANNKTFLVSDDADMATPELISRIAMGYGKKSKLIKFPLPLLKIFLFLIGKISLYRRLTASMQVDISETKRVLGWAPPFAALDQIEKSLNVHKD